MIGRQEETIATSVSQFKGVRILDALVVGPVDGASTSLVDGGNDAAIRVASVIQRLQCSDGLSGKLMQFFFVFNSSVRVSIWIEEHLGIAVNGHKSLDVAMRFHKFHNGFDLWFRVSAGSTVGLRAGIATSTSTSKASVPIPVGVNSNTAGARVWLSSFTPHTISGMGVSKAIRVGDDLQEDVIVVKDVCKGGVFSVVSYNLFGKPDSTGLCDPFSGVNASVKPDTRTVCSCAELCETT